MKTGFGAIKVFGICMLCAVSVPVSMPLNLTLDYFLPIDRGDDGTIGETYLIGLENYGFQKYWYYASGVKFGYVPGQYTYGLNAHFGSHYPPGANGIPLLFAGIGPDILISNLPVVPEPGSNKLRGIQISLLSVHAGCVLFGKISLNAQIWVSDPQLFALGIGYMY